MYIYQCECPSYSRIYTTDELFYSVPYSGKCSRCKQNNMTCVSLGASSNALGVDVCPSVCPGASQRASDNFKVPISGGYRVYSPPGISFIVLRYNFLGVDQPVASGVTNGTTINLDTGNNYYIGGPHYATEPFKVCFLSNSAFR